MKNFILSVQHLLAMYAGAILVPIIVGTSLKFSAEEIAYLVTVDIFMCGVATFLQANKVTGTGLPIVLGCTFTAVAPMILIGQTKGLDVLYGSLLISGILVVLIAPFFSYLVKFFPPVVTGSVVTIIEFNVRWYYTTHYSYFTKIYKGLLEINCDTYRIGNRYCFSWYIWNG